MNSPSLTYDANKGEELDNKGRVTSKSPKGMMQYMYPLGCALLVSILVGMFWLNPNYNKSINNVGLQLTNSIGAVKTADQTANSAMAGNISSMQTMYDGKIATINSGLGTASALANTAQALAQTAKTTADSALSIANSAASTDKINSLIETATSSIINKQTADETTIANLKTQMATDEAANAALTVIVNKLVATSSGSGTGGTGGTGSTSNVTVNIPNNLFGSNVVGFTSGVAANSTVTQSFSINVVNGATSAYNNLVLGMVLQITNVAFPNGYTLPSGVNVSISTNVPALVWTQATGSPQPYWLGFQSGVNTSSFGSLFGSYSLPIGTTSYTLTISVSNTTASAIPAFSVMPMLVVITP